MRSGSPLWIFFSWIIYWCTFLGEVTLVHEMTSHLGGTHVQLNQSQMPMLTLDPCRGHLRWNHWLVCCGDVQESHSHDSNASTSINPDKCIYASFAANSLLVYFILPTCQPTWTESTSRLQVVAINTQRLSSGVQRHKMESFDCSLQFNDR